MAFLEDLVIARGKRGITGKINPWQLPQWQPTIQGVRKQGALTMEDLASTLRKSDVRGPAAGTLLEKGAETTQGNILDLSNRLAMVPEEYASQGLSAEQVQNARKLEEAKMVQAAQQADIERTQRLKESESQRLLAAEQMRQAGYMWQTGRKDQEKYARYQGTTASGGAAMGQAESGGTKGCNCAIFTRNWTRVLEGSVRRFRDFHFTPQCGVSRGYKWMAGWLAPIQQRNDFIQWVVERVMLHPLSRIARNWENIDKNGWLFVPVGLFWCILWEMIGRTKTVLGE